MFAKAAAFAAAFTIALGLATTSVAAGGGCHPPSDPATERTGTTIDVKGCLFGPTVLRAPVGASVTWTNYDVVPHAIAGSGWVAAENPISQGASVSHTFDKAGVYTYMCYLHPGMAGVIVVGDAALGPSGGQPSAAAPATPSSTPDQLPLAIGLIAGAALGVAGYRLADGAVALRRGHRVHAG